jgi:ribosomal protein S18 acetylase RimI-like enzyme
MIAIRIALPEDAALLSELAAQTFVETFGNDNTPENMSRYLAETFSPERQLGELQEARNRFLLVFAGETPIGYAQLRSESTEPCVTGPEPIELVRIYIARAWHGRKLGAALMQRCLEEAARMGGQTIWLGVWEHNTRARRFYAQWGFVAVGSHIFQLGDDPQTDLILQRPIAAPAAMPEP